MNNEEIVKQRLADTLCKQTLVTMACLDILEGHNKDMTTKELAEIIVSTINTPYSMMQKINAQGCYYAEQAVEQLIKQGFVNECPPDMTEQELENKET